ncbi:MAG: DUF115 domain-containing protein [Spirochaetales bacterium]|nr:DUF115 domain-containing protein [Spirochaetales bacterium]
MLEFSQARSGILTASYSNKQLHSKFDPIKEAENFLQRQEIQSDSSIILIFPSLPYLTEIIEKRYPDSNLLTINPDDSFLDKYSEKSQPNHANIDQLEKIRNFIRKNILNQLKIISWEPACRIFSQEFRYIMGFLKEEIREQQHILATETKFGPLWIKNFSRNMKSLSQNLEINLNKAHVLILAPGPSLKSNISLIQKYSSKFVTIACSSSLKILSHFNIHPDMVINIDPGFYSGQYFDKDCAENTIGIFSATSNPLFCRFFEKKFVFSDNEDINRILSNQLPVPILTESASVTIAALKVAKNLNCGEVFFVGMDLDFPNKQPYPKEHESFATLRNWENRFDKPEWHLFHRNKISDYRSVLKLFHKNFTQIYQRYPFKRISSDLSTDFDISTEVFARIASNMAVKPEISTTATQINQGRLDEIFSHIKKAIDAEIDELEAGKIENIRILRLLDLERVRNFKNNRDETISYFRSKSEKYE